MMETPHALGEAMYGKDYQSIQNFVDVHLNMAAARGTDKLHDGMGFLTQHMALTTEFEMSVQSISPHIAVPYWDYTYDWYIANQTADPLATLWSLEVWQPTWFGTATGAHSTIEEGRFAYIKAARNDSAATTSPYGYLRAPWNVNKSPYLTRHHAFCGTSYSWQESSLVGGESAVTTSWPSCKSHWELTFNASTWYDWVWLASYAPHGPVHFMIGGYGDCGDVELKVPALGDKPNDKGEATTSIEAEHHKLNVGMLKESLLDIPKNMWRFKLAEFPTYCSDDTPQQDCHMVCKENVTDEVFRDFVVNTTLGPILFGDWISKLPADVRGQFLEWVCSTPFTTGEQMEAASPLDPSFWPIHPTMERLLHWKRIIQPFANSSWAAPDDGETTYCVYHNTALNSKCAGHHVDDTTFWQVYHEDDVGNFTRSYLTNGEVFNIAEPHESYRLSYVYDNFAWLHCDASGYAFRSKLASHHGQ